MSLTGPVCAQVPGNKAAIGQHYNVASDRYISHDGVVQALAKAAGVEANIVHYDTTAISLAKVLLLHTFCRSWLQASHGLKKPECAPWPYKWSCCCSGCAVCSGRCRVCATHFILA